MAGALDAGCWARKVPAAASVHSSSATAAEDRLARDEICRPFPLSLFMRDISSKAYHPMRDSLGDRKQGASD